MTTLSVCLSVPGLSVTFACFVEVDKRIIEFLPPGSSIVISFSQQTSRRNSQSLFSTGVCTGMGVWQSGGSVGDYDRLSKRNLYLLTYLLIDFGPITFIIQPTDPVSYTHLTLPTILRV